MTTPQLKPHPQTVATVATETATTAIWEPFPPQPPKRLDMEQALPANILLETLRHILTPGFRDAYAYHPTIFVDDQIPIFYDPGTPPGRQRPVIPDCTIALDVDTRAAHARWGYDPIQLGKPPDLVIEFASRSAYRVVLDLNFRWNGRQFTIHHPYTGVEYLHPREEIVQLSAENLRLRAEIRRLRGRG